MFLITREIERPKREGIEGIVLDKEIAHLVHIIDVDPVGSDVVLNIPVDLDKGEPRLPAMDLDLPGFSLLLEWKDCSVPYCVQSVFPNDYSSPGILHVLSAS